MAQPLLFRLIDKADFDYALIEPGDKILIGASGGKDSTALIEYFGRRLMRPNPSFECFALHVESEITPSLKESMRSLYLSWNIPFGSLHIDVLGRLKSGRHMNCWWCSTQRRTELLDYAIAHGYNKIALGHHLDDVLETLFMNALNKGELSTMPPKLVYRNYPVAVIRPLYYACVEIIKQHCSDAGYMTETCTCTYQDNSERVAIRKKIDFLTGGDLKKKQQLLKALKNILPEYLP